jgi:hypothetical protein
MFTTKKNDDLALLEATVTRATADLAASKAAHREARIDFEVAKGLIAESESVDNLTAHREAMEATQAAAQAVRVATEALAAAERALELHKTGPQRAETAKRPRAAAAALEKSLPALRLALAQTVAALDAGGFPEIAGWSHSARMFGHWIYGANGAATGGDAEMFVRELRAHAEGVLSGEKPATLQPTLAEQNEAQRRAG